MADEALVQGQLIEDFYLEHENGERLYAVAIKDRDSGQVAKGSNTKEAARYITNPASVYPLVEAGMSVRARTRNGKIEGLYKVGRRSIRRLVRLAK